MNKVNKYNIFEITNNIYSKGLYKYTNVFSEYDLNKFVDEILYIDMLGSNGKLLNNIATYNKTSKRIQINFGYYFSYGFSQFERIYGKGVQPTEEELNIYNELKYVPTEPLPKWMDDIIDKLIEVDIIKEENRYNSALVNIYNKNGSIPPHLDHDLSFERNVCTIRLQNPTVMSFGYSTSNSNVNNYQYAKIQNNVIPYRISLNVGDVVIMTGNSCNIVTHGIFPDDVPQQSISLTFRKILPKYKPNKYKSYQLKSLF